MTVLVIAAVLFSIAAPRSNDRDQCSAAARSMVADGARARSYSVRTWEPVQLEVDVVIGAWRVLRQDGSALDLPGAGPSGWRTLEPGVTFEAVPGFAADATFLPNGRAEAESRVRIRSGARSWIVRVETLTARIVAEPET